MSEQTNESGLGLLISNKAYDVLKQVTTIWLPAAGTLYFTVAQVWGLPYAEQVVGTIAAVAVFFGVILNISSSTFNKTGGAGSDGTLSITSGDEKDTYLLQINQPLEMLKGKDSVTLKVEENPSTSQ